MQEYTQVLKSEKKSISTCKNTQVIKRETRYIKYTGCQVSDKEFSPLFAWHNVSS